jgi:hypothetical protein
MNAKAIASIARKHLKLLNTDRHYSQVNLSPHHDGSAHFEELPNGGYRYVYTERGIEYDERITDEPEDILYWLYQDATFAMALVWELNNRITGRDSRRLIFSKQLELLRVIGEKYALRREKEMETILLAHPFNDGGLA